MTSDPATLDAPGDTVRFGISLAYANPGIWTELAAAADAAGFESVWQSDHLVIPPGTGGDANEDRLRTDKTPLFDPIGNLCWLAHATERIKLGTFVYILGLRHPFVGARGFATLDVLSGGHALAGVGIGSLRSEYEAMGIDPCTRGSRLDEAIDVCRLLWSGEDVEYHGRHFDFAPLSLHPPLVSQPLPIYVGGDSDASMRHAARRGDGWIAEQMHTPTSVAPVLDRLRGFAEEVGRQRPIEVTVRATIENEEEIEAFVRLGVTRLIVVPWRRTSEAIAGVRDFAARFLDSP